MQFIVFAAFAIILSVPEGGAPWRTLDGGVWALVGAVGQVVLAGAVGWWGTAAVRRKLEREPAWLPAAQRRLARVNAAIRGVVIIGFGFSIYLTDAVPIVRGWPRVSEIWGLDEVILLAPFMLAIAAAWIALYPADRAVRRVSLENRLLAAAPGRPVWTPRRYLSFMFRQHVLIMAVPMLPIVIANDAVYAYRHELRDLLFDVPWADQVVLVVVAGLVFLFAPMILSHVWHTRPLPPGDLRTKLEEICAKARLGYRRILIWESDGMVVNAAVMGLFKPVRYILLSDGLLEMMDDRKIEAVFGHEAGHVKHKHIQYYLLFAVLSMLIVGGVMELAMWAYRRWPERLEQLPAYQDYLQVGAMAMIVAIWSFGFGFVSRRFEWQADLFGARSVTPEAAECDHPCHVHGTADGSESDVRPDKALCATSAGWFAEALYRIAVLNGIPIEARSWRHSSIANRMALLKAYRHDPERVARLHRVVNWIKAVLLGGVVAGVLIAALLYWPE